MGAVDSDGIEIRDYTKNSPKVNMKGLNLGNSIIVSVKDEINSTK
ncbi:hypothetical protein A3Q56_02879 [Intoshia linei]|uniref:Uncharacterized protein n=1 Tax=Intoshia linei TaxID=1819745 RepID=A0A177B6T4_9BILA|nr:hypothetical protein A3Q56_02879 [Intoshia linei]